MKPYPSLPFILETDASDEGKGAVLFQLPDPEKPDERNTIFWASKAWDRTMIDAPTYYQEADAHFWGVALSAPYVDASVAPLVARVDQVSLKWVKNSTKGRVTAWRLAQEIPIEYSIEYLPGDKNCIADACSRPPMLGPRRVARLGLEFMLGKLLSTADRVVRSASSFRLWAGKDTRMINERLRRYCLPGRPTVRQSSAANGRVTADFSIFVPPAHVSPALLRHVIDEKISGAVLLPTDLIYAAAYRRAKNGKDRHDGGLADAISACAKIIFTAATMTWVITHPGIKCCACFPITATPAVVPTTNGAGGGGVL